MCRVFISFYVFKTPQVNSNLRQSLNTCSNTDIFQVFWFERLFLEVLEEPLKMNVNFKWFSSFRVVFV